MHDFFTSFRNRVHDSPERTAVRRTEGLSVSYRALAVAIRSLADRLPDTSKTVAIAGLPSISWIVADLAATLKGCRVVPLPFFFSAAQQAHILKDAGVDLIVWCDMPVPDATGPGLALEDALLFRGVVDDGLIDLNYSGGAERVIYTSGTTGAPKGVRHGDRQLDFALGALGAAAAASPTDRHLSLLPPSLLLEQIAGQFLPLSLGAEVVIAASACRAALSGDIMPTAAALSEVCPTTTVLVPQQLTGLVHFAAVAGWTPPNSLRLVAVGGAPISPDILAKAREIGFPVRFGYGLSECCSVVSVQTGESGGATGRPIPGTEVEIVDGEIVVQSPGVMIGYLGSDPLDGPVWHTGDLGRLEPDGQLTVVGRKDRRITLANGRNLSPEWVESLATALPWIGSARVTGTGQDRASLSVTVRQQADQALRAMPDDMLSAHLHTAFKGLPAYAVPGTVTIDGTDWTRDIALPTDSSLETSDSKETKAG